MCLLFKSGGKPKMVNTTLDGWPRAWKTLSEFPFWMKPGSQASSMPNSHFPRRALPKGNFEAAKAALEANPGITLVMVKRPIGRVVLDPLPTAA
jgi:hypothetical protein